VRLYAETTRREETDALIAAGQALLEAWASEVHDAAQVAVLSWRLGLC
jgi:hypothetical protein